VAWIRRPVRMAFSVSLASYALAEAVWKSAQRGS
jgi:hypothetical protein